MKKIKCIISYDGTNYSGYQVQPGKRTIQTELEKALTKIHKGKEVAVYASGRTDTGVHAKGQVIHFSTPLSIVNERWKKALNTLLPKDIRVINVEEADEAFHARFQATEKEYRYFILNDKEADVFKRNYYYHYPFSLDFEKIKTACKQFEGTHDFTSFSSARATVKNDKIRTLFEVDCEQEGNIMMIKLRGNGFLYHMVRIIVGVLLEVGSGRMEVAEIEEMFAKKDRTRVGPTAPPEGLYLWEVCYDEKS